MKQNGEDADSDQGARNAQVKTVHTNHRERHKDKVELGAQRLFAQLHNREENQTDSGGSYTFQPGGGPGTIAMSR